MKSGKLIFSITLDYAKFMKANNNILLVIHDLVKKPLKFENA